MGNSKGIITTCIIIVLVVFGCQSCSPRQDNTNFNKFLNQDVQVKGKAGVLITTLGQPEDYDYVIRYIR